MRYSWTQLAREVWWWWKEEEGKEEKEGRKVVPGKRKKIREGKRKLL